MNNKSRLSHVQVHQPPKDNFPRETSNSFPSLSGKNSKPILAQENKEEI